MKTPASSAIVFKSISELMRAIGTPKPVHPLIALVDYDVTKISRQYVDQNILIDFYKVSYKREYRGQVKYGQGYYDFEEGGLAFLGPNQLVRMSAENPGDEGFALYFHADLIRGYQLGRDIAQYGLFSYAVNEALFLSEKEKNVIEDLFEMIRAELNTNIDAFSEAVLVSQIELLLNHSNRFYNRQFFTRKAAFNDLITRMNQYLTDRFSLAGTEVSGLPTVVEVSEHLGVSPRYLTDMLTSLTGQSTQQHIHNRLIEKAKTILVTSQFSVAEIAYQLGFEHPQSFHKIFKKTTNLSPNAFRQSFQ